MAEETLREEVRRAAETAKAASMALAQTTGEQRNAALAAMAAALRAHEEDVLAANGRDMEAARAEGTKESLLDRLLLDSGRIEAMACALEDLAALPDPVGVVQEERTLDNGLRLARVSVPLGVVAMVYEARPNVTADAAGICVKSGNAAVLRCGRLAAASSAAIAQVLHDAAVEAGMPRGCIVMVDSADRAAADEAHAAARRGGRAHSPRWRGTHPPLRRACEGAGRRDGHGQLPRVRARERRCRHGALHRAEREVPPLRRVQRGRDPAGGPFRGAQLPAPDAMAALAREGVLAALRRRGVSAARPQAAGEAVGSEGFETAFRPRGRRTTGPPSTSRPSWPCRCVEGVQEAIAPREPLRHETFRSHRGRL